LKSLLKYRNSLWALLGSLGPWGVFLIAGLDGAGIPLPGAVDAVVVTSVHQHPGRSWLYIILAAGGSALGCLVLYGIGYAGGEVLIAKRMSPAKFEKIRDDFEAHPILTLGLPALLPPPFPLKPFVLAAGAFEMRWTHFLGVMFAGRFVRFGILAALTVLFGPQVITLFNNVFRHHLVVFLIVLAAAIVLAVLAHRHRQR
jgi:membrane protein YqaA with SNARE-associated domain